MATKNTTTVEPVIVELSVRTDMKNVVKFETMDTMAPVTNIYIKKTTPGVNEAKSVKVTVEVN